MVKNNQNIKEKAAEPTVNYNQKFKEEVVLDVKSASQIYGYLLANRNTIQSQIFPSGLGFADGVFTFSVKGGLVIENPLKDEPFYKVEVELEDADQQNLQAWISVLDGLWGETIVNKGLSVGIDASLSYGDSKIVYWYHHAQLKLKGQIPDDQYDWSLKAQNKFVRRKTGKTKIEIYVTPNGTYPVVNGANFASFPDTYRGSYIYYPERPFKYIVLGKWDYQNEPVTFSNLKVTKLDANITSVEDVNAYFVKKTIEAGLFKASSSSAGANGVPGFQDALTLAFLYRAYDHYYGTDNKKLVQDLFDQFFITGLETHVSNGGGYIQQLPFYTWAVSGYLRPDQLLRVRKSLAHIVDGLIPVCDPKIPDCGGDHYIGDSYAENYSFYLSYLAGYYALYPNDNPRSEYILDILKFMGHYILGEGKSIREVYPSPAGNYFKYLPSRFLDFKAKFIYDNYLIDNHGRHPSVHYAFGTVATVAYVANVLEKYGLDPYFLRRNLSAVYQANIKDYLDPYKFIASKTIDVLIPGVGADEYTYSPQGYIVDFAGGEYPSRMEDWGEKYTRYHSPEIYGDYQLADIFAKNVYYSFYLGSGKLFCGHVDPNNDGQKCDFGSQNAFSYLFGYSLNSMLFSKRSSFFNSNFYQTVPMPVPDDAPFTRPSLSTPAPTSIPTATPLPINHPPVITTVVLPPVQVGSGVNLQITGEDIDVNDDLQMVVTNLPVSLRVSSCEKSHNQISRITCNLTGEVDREGNYRVDITLLDKKGSISQESLSLNAYKPSYGSVRRSIGGFIKNFNRFLR